MLQPGKRLKPVVTLQDAAEFAHKLYGFSQTTVLELNGYDDCNFHVKVKNNEENHEGWPHGYVLKVINELDSANEISIQAQNELMLYLGNLGIKCPQPVKNVHHNYYHKEKISGKEHIVRLLTFQPGVLLHQVSMTKDLLYQAGQYIAKLDIALQGFHHTSFEDRESMWMLKNCPLLKNFIFAVKSEERQRLVSNIIEMFETKILKKASLFEKGLIHADFNEQNILVGPSSLDGGWEVSGILDFGDAHCSLYLFELAIAMCYLMLQVKDSDPVSAGASVISGYTTIKSLHRQEMALLKLCVCARLSQSLVLGAYSYMHNADDYLLITSANGWDLLSTLWNTPDEEVNQLWGIMTP